MLEWLSRPTVSSRSTLILGVAVIYSGMSVLNNNLLFAWLSDAPFRHWVYLPAGFRLIAIMLFGWLGVAGIAIGQTLAWLTRGIDGLSLGDAALLGTIRAMSVWAGLAIYAALTKVRAPWENLSWTHVPFLISFVSLFSAFVTEATLYWFGLSDLQTLVRDALLSSIGAILGSLIVVALVLWLRRSYLASARKPDSDR
jgi:hypothetical protein